MSSQSSHFIVLVDQLDECFKLLVFDSAFGCRVNKTLSYLILSWVIKIDGMNNIIM